MHTMHKMCSDEEQGSWGAFQAMHQTARLAMLEPPKEAMIVLIILLTFASQHQIDQASAWKFCNSFARAKARQANV